MPSQNDRSAFTVGEDLALTLGAVVYRDEVVEVLHYTPSTPTVRQRPLLIVPPPIGRFYFLDLRPGRSFVEHALSRGLQVFLLSWRNPTAEQADWDLDTYATRMLTALDVVKDITGSEDVNACPASHRHRPRSCRASPRAAGPSRRAGGGSRAASTSPPRPHPSRAREWLRPHHQPTPARRATPTAAPPTPGRGR